MSPQEIQLRRLMREEMIDRWVRYRDKPDIPIDKTVQKFRYPFKTMELGAHFFVPREGKSAQELDNCLTASIRHARKTTSREFYMQRYPTGARVWRIA